MRLTTEEEQAIAGLLLHLMRVYVVADKYDIAALRAEVLVHYERLAPLLVLHKQAQQENFEEMVDVIYGTGLDSADRLRKKFMGDVVREVYPLSGTGRKGRVPKDVLRSRRGVDWEMEEVERIVRSCVFKVRTVGMGREWKREFMRDMKREVRREVKRRWRGRGEGSL